MVYLETPRVGLFKNIWVTGGQLSTNSYSRVNEVASGIFHLFAEVFSSFGVFTWGRGYIHPVPPTPTCYVVYDPMAQGPSAMNAP